MSLELRYGLLNGFLLCLWVLAEYALGLHSEHLDIGRYSGYASSIIPIVILYHALKLKRNSLPAGAFRLMDGVRSGFVISLITAVIITAFFYVYNNFINPDWLLRAMEWERQQLVQSGMSPAEIQARMSQMQSAYSPTAQILWGLIGTTAIGTVFSLVLAFVLQRSAGSPPRSS